MDANMDSARDPSEGHPLDDSTFASLPDSGGDGGGDFLGLGKDLDAHMSSGLDEEDYEYSDEEQGASWLFTLDEEAAESEPIFAAPTPAPGMAFQVEQALDWGEADAAEAAPAAPASPFVPDAYDPAAQRASVPGPGLPGHGMDHAQEELLAGPATLDASWTEPESSTGLLRRHAVRLAAAVVVLGVGIAGWQLYGVGGDLVSSPETEVLAPEQNKTPKYAPRLQSPDGQPGNPSNRRAVRGPGGPGGSGTDVAAAVEPAPIAVPEALLARATPRASTRGRWRSLLGMDTPGAARLLDGLPTLDSGPMGPRIGSRGDAAGGPELMRRSGRLQTEFVDVPSFPNLRLATSEDLENVWPGFEIPVDEYGREQRLLTPYVGEVRAVLDSGDIFEGRLYAVGQNRVWVETGWGVVALETYRIDAVVHVAPVEGDLARVDGPITRMPRIRVEAQGGGFPARLLYQDDRGATVVTEGGMRVTVRPSDVDIVGLTPSIVLAEDPLR